MILVDSSVWIDHLRSSDKDLLELLNSGQVLIHPFVIGELACGNLKNRKEILQLLQDLPQAPVASELETLFFIEHHKLMGHGIGYIDAHLLAAASLMERTRLWTRDKRLDALAASLDLSVRRQDKSLKYPEV